MCKINNILKEVIYTNKLEFLFSAVKIIGQNSNIYKVPIHFHKEVEISYWKDAKVEYEIDFKNYYIDSEAIVLINRNTPHSLKINKKSRGCTYLYTFDMCILEGGIDDFISGKYIIPLIESEIELPNVIYSYENQELFKKLKSVLLQIYEINEEKKYAYELKIKAELMNFFALLYEYEVIKPKDKSVKDRRKTDNINKILSYIHDNYNKNINLDSASEKIKLNSSYFSKYFKDYTNKNFSEYLNSYRLLQASQLLINTQLPITEICYEVGFRNLSYFIRKFKKEFNLTPAKYREKYN